MICPYLAYRFVSLRAACSYEPLDTTLLALGYAQGRSGGRRTSLEKNCEATGQRAIRIDWKHRFKRGGNRTESYREDHPCQ